MKRVLFYYITVVTCVVFLTSVTHGQSGTAVVQTRWRYIFTLNVAATGASRTSKARSMLQCGQQCAGWSGCQSFGFHKQSETCVQYGYLVEYSCNGTSAPGTRYYWPRRSCPTQLGYTQNGDLCWRLTGQNNVGWHEARSLCRTQGAIHFVADSPSALSILYSVDPTNTIWVGANDFCSDGEYRWLTGVPVTENWLPTEPSPLPGQSCVERDNAGTFQNVICNSPMSSFVCQVPM